MRLNVNNQRTGYGSAISQGKPQRFDLPIQDTILVKCMAAVEIW